MMLHKVVDPFEQLELMEILQRLGIILSLWGRNEKNIWWSIQ